MLVVGVTLAAVVAGLIVVVTSIRLVGILRPSDDLLFGLDGLEADDPWETLRVRVLSLEIASAAARRENEKLQAELRRAQSRVTILENVSGLSPRIAV